MAFSADLVRAFDRVVVIGLQRRPERLAQFWKRLGDWPFARPQHFAAVDGEAVGVPAAWDKGPGAWGCLLSHRAVIDSAIADGVGTMLVLEDDAYPVPDFAARARKFLEAVPEDWDCLMLGAQHLQPPIAVSEAVVRCVASTRTHAYAVRGKFMRVLSQFWANDKNDHCDLVLSSLFRHFKAYSPQPLLLGQDCGYSDITGRGERLRFLSTGQIAQIAPADPRCMIEQLVTRVPVSREAMRKARWEAAKLCGIIPAQN